MTVAAVDELDPATVRGLVAGAGDPKREGWLQQVRRTGARRHPVRLRGVVLRGDERVYSTVDEPDGALMVRCGNRREACCSVVRARVPRRHVAARLRRDGRRTQGRA